MEEKYIGVIQDPRSEEEKAKDYKHEDLAAGDVKIIWREKLPEELKNFKIRNQDGSSACVAFATAKILGMHEVIEGRPYADLSPKFIYTRRSNYPDGGMWLPNALEIACKNGACLEVELPCDNQGEAYMNDKGQEEGTDAESAALYRAKFYFEIKNRSIDQIAKVLEQGYGVLLGFRFEYDEWTEVPQLLYQKDLWSYSCGHGIPAADYSISSVALSAFLLEGKKVLVIEDSWGPGHGKGGRRFITEEFLNARCFYAGYVTSLPNYQFSKTLKTGSAGLDVKMLQQTLNKIGYTLTVDGKFGRKTFNAVLDLQRRHKLLADGIVGPKTNAVLNTL